jgi:hypothetical protein
VLTDVEQFFNQAHCMLNEMIRTGHRMSIEKMKGLLPSTYDALKK